MDAPSSTPLMARWGESHFHAWQRADGLLVDLRNYDKGFPPAWEAHLLGLGVPQPVLDSARASVPVGYALLAG